MCDIEYGRVYRVSALRCTKENRISGPVGGVLWFGLRKLLGFCMPALYYFFEQLFLFVNNGGGFNVA